MRTGLSILVIAGLAAAAPHEEHHSDPAWAQQGAVVSHGPWVEDPTYVRGPKEFASPTKVLGRASSFWDWDR